MTLVINNLLISLKENIKLGKESSPFLFLWTNSELLNSEVFSFSRSLLGEFSIPYAYLYKLEDNLEKIKISQIKDFLSPSFVKVPYDFQIFIIENISRLTIGAWNSLLKFLEEPWKQNIVFLTNSWTNNILDTIISRVNIVNTNISIDLKENLFFRDLINNFFSKSNSWKTALYSYFFKSSLEKEDYIDFLNSLLLFAKKNIWLIDTKILENIDFFIYSIKNNNVNAKYIVDSLILKL